MEVLCGLDKLPGVGAVHHVRHVHWSVYHRDDVTTTVGMWFNQRVSGLVQPPPLLAEVT